jgi:hypothetical protein
MASKFLLLVGLLCIAAVVFGQEDEEDRAKGKKLFEKA